MAEHGPKLKISKALDGHYLQEYANKYPTISFNLAKLIERRSTTVKIDDATFNRGLIRVLEESFRPYYNQIKGDSHSGKLDLNELVPQQDQEYIKNTIELTHHYDPENPATPESLLHYVEKMLMVIDSIYSVKQRSLVIVVDEYDTPLHNVIENDENQNLVLERLTSFMRVILKENKFLYKGVVTGIERVTSATFYSGFNCAIFNNLLSPKLSEFYGITEEDLKNLYFECVSSTPNQDMDRFMEYMSFYNGYLTPKNQKIYNVWSVFSHMDAYLESFRTGVFPPQEIYWANTSCQNTLVHILLKLLVDEADQFKTLLLLLRKEKPFIETKIQDDISLENYLFNQNNVWTILFYNGYLTLYDLSLVEHKRKLKVPNDEVVIALNKIIQSVCEKLSMSVYFANNYLKNVKIQEFINLLNGSMKRAFSFRRFNKEIEYEIYFASILLMVNPADLWAIETQNLPLHGTSDVIAYPHGNAVGLEDAFIFELKQTKNENEVPVLIQLMQKGMDQIKRKNYSDRLEKKPYLKRIHIYSVVGFDRQFHLGCSEIVNLSE